MGMEWRVYLDFGKRLSECLSDWFCEVHCLVGMYLGMYVCIPYSMWMVELGTLLSGSGEEVSRCFGEPLLEDELWLVDRILLCLLSALAMKC